MDLLSKVPMLDVTINERFSFAGACAIVLLAALGLEHALARDDLRVVGRVMTALLVLLAFGELVIQRSELVTDAMGEWGIYARFAELACLGVGALWLSLHRAPPGAEGSAGYRRAVVPHCCSCSSPSATSRTATSIRPFPRSAPTLPCRSSTPSGAIRGRSASWPCPRPDPRHERALRLEDVRGYEALTFGRYFETYRLWCVHQPVWFNRVDDIGKPFLNFLNVRYAVSSDDMKAPDGWRVIAKQRGSQLLENANVLERAFIPRPSASACRKATP